MLLDTLNVFQKLLLPLLLGALVVGGLAVYLVGRKPRPRQRPATRQPAVTARPTAAAPPAPVPAPPTASAPAIAPAPALAPAPAPTPTPAADGAEPPPAHATGPALPWQADLLLVDDSAVVRAKLRRLFEPAGYRTVLARDGAEALALLEQGRYGLMVTDLEMPNLDGVGLIRASLSLPGCTGMPILAITGHDDLQSQLNQLNAVAGIYRKPWLDDDLLGHVQALVQASTLRELATEAG